MNVDLGELFLKMEDQLVFNNSILTLIIFFTSSLLLAGCNPLAPNMKTTMSLCERASSFSEFRGCVKKNYTQAPFHPKTLVFYSELEAIESDLKSGKITDEMAKAAAWRAYGVIKGSGGGSSSYSNPSSNSSSNSQAIRASRDANARLDRLETQRQFCNIQSNSSYYKRTGRIPPGC